MFLKCNRRWQGGILEIWICFKISQNKGKLIFYLLLHAICLVPKRNLLETKINCKSLKSIAFRFGGKIIVMKYKK